MNTRMIMVAALGALLAWPASAANAVDSPDPSVFNEQVRNEQVRFLKATLGKATPAQIRSLRDETVKVKKERARAIAKEEGKDPDDAAEAVDADPDVQKLDKTISDYEDENATLDELTEAFLKVL